MDLCSESLLRRQLFEEVKGVTWLLMVSGRVNRTPYNSYGTGFSVSKNGLIMTCDHILPPHGNDITFTVKARKLDEDFFREARVKYRHSKWDVAVLKLNDPINCKEGLLASDGSLYPGQPLAHLGNPSDHFGTFVVGRARYRCVDDVEWPTGKETCETYNSSAVWKTPRYRIMGHYVNSKVYYRPGDDCSGKALDPMVPVVVTSGLSCGPGSSGGPLFKSDGTIIGMLARGSHISIHVSILRECLRIANSKEETS